MKEEYQKPLIASEAGIAGAFPALIGAFVAGAEAVTAARKVLKGYVGWEKVNKLVEVSVSV